MERRRLLVVDDEPSLTRLLKFSLEQTGRYEVWEEHRGSQALLTAQLFQPDVVLLDIIMPDMDGATVATSFKADPILRHIPIVFLTAIVSREETGSRPKLIGGYPFIAKPASMEEIVTCIEQQFDRR